MKKLYVLMILIVAGIFIVACGQKTPTVTSKLDITNLGFASVGADNKVVMDVVKTDTPLFLYAEKIGDFTNTNGEIQPKVIVEILETGYSREFFGAVIKTEGKSMDSSTFPLGIVPAGTYTTKITVMDLIAGIQVSKEKQLVVS
ncbi:hypothetical protein KY336_01415 [Candidatus Woesearchaeota archaeon]|nr:hypothetical protein [Candidatus Woesearchaeota archaeon]